MCYNGLSLVKVQDKKYDRVQDRELVMNCNNLITSLGAGWKDKICFCIETVSDILKNTAHLVHSRHRSFDNFISSTKQHRKYMHHQVYRFLVHLSFHFQLYFHNRRKTVLFFPYQNTHLSQYPHL